MKRKQTEAQRAYHTRRSAEARARRAARENAKMVARRVVERQLLREASACGGDLLPAQAARIEGGTAALRRLVQAGHLLPRREPEGTRYVLMDARALT